MVLVIVFPYYRRNPDRSNCKFVAEDTAITRPVRWKFSILELLGVIAVVALVSAVWQTGQDRGIIATVVSASCLAYYFNQLRPQIFPLPTTLISLPLIAFGVFVLSLTLGLRHPPFMVPPDWEWPPFASFEERAVHAFALSIWTFIFGTPTILLLGMFRRLLGSSQLTTNTATNK